MTCLHAIFYDYLEGSNHIVTLNEYVIIIYYICFFENLIKLLKSLNFVDLQLRKSCRVFSGEELVYDLCSVC